jgi:hypothetical protein
MRLRLQVVFGGLLICILGAGRTSAAEKPDFQRDVLPLFEAKCLRCHGEKKKDAKLDMRTVDTLLLGGVTGPAIKPGNAQKSLLIELLHYNEMPPKKEKSRVTKEELALLRRWIDAMPAAPAATR